MIALAILVAAAVGDAPAQATPDPVRVVTAEDRKACKYLGLVTVRKSLGGDKVGAALRKAMAEVAKMDGNGLFIITQAANLWEGVSINGEALRCPVMDVR